MFFWVIQNIIISLVLIILIHYLYVFFKTNLTVPKIKDLVERPEKKYKEIYASLSSKSTDTKPTIVPEKKPDNKIRKKINNKIETVYKSIFNL